MNRSEVLKEISENIERFVHQDSDRMILHSILNHAGELMVENEMLAEENKKLNLEVMRLETYEKFYDDFIKYKMFLYKS